ncbi:MAG: hypothetical protein U0930_05560 [Pirellulales bacterium]
MRLKRPAQATAAIRCPSCRAIFEVRSAELKEEPIIAELVEDVPLEALIMDDPIAEHQEASAPYSPLSVVDIDEFDSPSSPPNRSPFETPQPRNRNRAANKQAPSSIVKSPSDFSGSRKLKLLIGIGSGSVLLIAIMGFVAVKFLFSSGSSGSAQLMDRYRDALASAKDALARQASQPDTATINSEVDRMQLVLIDSVKLSGADDSQLKDARGQLDALSSLTREVKRNCTLLPLASSRGTKVDQLPLMIDLIEKQFNYGHRKVVDNKERPNRFLIEAFEHFHTIDQRLAESLKSAEAPDLNTMGTILDRLDESCVRYGEAALDRFEMTFEQKQIFDSGESFRKWSLNQLSQAGHEKQCVALGKEIDAQKKRFDQALRATRLDSLTLSGLDRINKRIAEPTGTLFSTADNGKSTSDTKPSSTSESVAGSPLAGTSATGTSGLSRREGSSGGSTPEAKVSPESTQSNSSSNNDLIAKSPNHGSESANNIAQPNVIASSLNAARQEFGQEPVLDPNRAPMFPEARFRMGSSLAIKMVTRKSKAELDQIATLLSRKFNAPLVDVQLHGKLATISFSTFPKKPSDIIPDLSFGKVEICDSQSRTVFINDYE